MAASALTWMLTRVYGSGWLFSLGKAYHEGMVGVSEEFQGPPDSDYTGGRYHGRILLPSQYPFKPPDIMMLTPSGRFETNKKICLSISSFHPKNWQPSWSIRTVLTALIAFFPTPGAGAIGSLEYSSHERKEYAARSSAWKCDLCGQSNLEMLPDLAPGVLERAGGPPKLDKEVQDTIDANRAVAAVTVASQPGTPALGPHHPHPSPPTPVSLSQAQRIVAECPPSGPTSPAFVRSYSEPVAGANDVGAGEMVLPPQANALTPSSSASSASAAAPAAASLALDEGLRQRQGRVVVAGESAAQVLPPQTAVPAPVAGPAPVVQQVVHQRQEEGSGVFLTVFLALLIALILARKLYASSQAKAAFSFDFSQD